MKKVIALLLLATAGFTQDLILENLTSHPLKSSKMAIQWAASVQEMEEGNHALRQGLKLTSLQNLTKQGQISLSIPAKAEYFRVLVWSQGKEDPDLHTNWVEIVPDKTYTLQPDHLVPSVLMNGMGC